MRDFVIVIPDFCELPPVQRACDIVQEYISRYVNKEDEASTCTWRYADSGILDSAHRKYIRLFNLSEDEKYHSNGNVMYIMHLDALTSFRHIRQANKFIKVYRYDFTLRRAFRSGDRVKAINECPFEIGDFSGLLNAYQNIGTAKCENSNLRCEPFPGYKYGSAAYQNIVASREAMKRAENGNHAMDALRYCLPKGSFWDHVDLEQKRLAHDYMANDVNVTRELFEIYKKEADKDMEMYVRTTDSTKTLTGYVTDVTVTQTGADETCDTVEITLQIPRHVALSKNKYPLSLTVADVHKMVDNRKLTTLTFENPSAFMKPTMYDAVKPKKVIFNNPATIVLWNDGTKTVVTRQKGDRYNKEEGLALCYMKKALGNSSRAFNDALHAGLKMGEE